MNEKEKERLKEWVKKFLKDDLDKFDFEHELDLNITLEENKTILRDKIRLFFNQYAPERIEDFKKREAEIIADDSYKFHIEEQLRGYEEKAEEEFKKQLDLIANSGDNKIIEDLFFNPKQFIKMVINGNTKGFILFGEGGLGKSHLIFKTFKEENKDFAYLKGHITQLELYHFLFNHQNEFIVLDDINILDNENNLNLLKGCLDDNNRWVNYHTTSDKLECPSKFLFNGSLILLLNQKPRTNPSLRAVESRVLNYCLEFDYKTKLKLIFELSKKDYKGIEKEDRLKIAEFIKLNTSESTINLNFRLLYQFFEIFKYDKLNFERLAKSLLKVDEEEDLINSLVSKVSSIKEVCEEWCEITGKSRASFFRVYSRIKKKIR